MMFKDIKLDKDSQVSFKIAGLSYGEFARTGIPQIWSISKLLETGWYALLHMKAPLPFDHRNPQQCINVIYLLSIDITLDFYKSATSGSPLNVLAHKGHLGNTSASIMTKILDPQKKEVLVTNQRVFVQIDKITRKPVPIEQAIKARHGPPHPDYKALKLQQVEPPINAYHYQTKVCHSDTDVLYHSNQSSYLRFCMDAAAEATSKNYFNHFHGDMFEYKIKNVLALYLAETHPEDDLDIYAWEDKINENLLYFKITKQDKKTAFFSKILFYRDTLKHKL